MKVFDFFHRDRRATKAGGEGFAYPPEDGYPPSPDDKANKKGRRIKYNRKSFFTQMTKAPKEQSFSEDISIDKYLNEKYNPKFNWNTLSPQTRKYIEQLEKEGDKSNRVSEMIDKLVQSVYKDAYDEGWDEAVITLGKEI